MSANALARLRIVVDGLVAFIAHALAASLSIHDRMRRPSNWLRIVHLKETNAQSSI